jgi:hypothetical protein
MAVSIDDERPIFTAFTSCEVINTQVFVGGVVNIATDASHYPQRRRWTYINTH